MPIPYYTEGMSSSGNLGKKRYEKIRRFLWKQVWFPENTRNGYLFRFTVLFLSSATVALAILFFPQKEVKTATIIFCLFSILINAFLGNAPNGFLETGFATALLLILYYPWVSNFSIFYALEIGTFIVTGIAITAIIHFSKRIDLITEFNRRESAYKLSIHKMSEEKTKAEKEIKMRDEFISIASHELKTPLTSTLLKLQIALHNIRNVSLANFSVQNLLQMLESAEQQTKRLGRIINDLLNVSIIQTGKLELELEQCDISEMAKDVVESFLEKADKEKILLSVDAPKSVVTLCDKVRMEQVITNLISNAMKYGSGKPVSVSVAKQRDVVIVTVKDHGIGIPGDKKEMIFNLFERGVDGSQYKGLGIGLYISNQIIRAHNGSITVHSRVNHGSEFSVLLPVVTKSA